MTEYKPPHKPGKELLQGEMKIFLAGSIDNGKDTDWQSNIGSFLSTYDVALFNPRRGAVNFTQGINDPRVCWTSAMGN